MGEYAAGANTPVEAGVSAQRADMDIPSLIRAALAALPRAYAPYSHFYVAAALLGESGRVYTGINVENASYPAGICAERNAVSRAVAEGERRFQAIAIAGGLRGEVSDYCAPCGICRQVLREFCEPSELIVIMAKSETDYIENTLAELLPRSFGPASLK